MKNNSDDNSSSRSTPERRDEAGHTDPMIWNGCLDMLAGDALELRNALADAAHGSDWDLAFTLLDENPHSLSPNVWRPQGKSWFTPLHQAAWSNAPIAVVEELLGRGAWKFLTTSSGETASEIALRRGHTELATVLTPEVPWRFDIEIYKKLDHQLAQLVESRIRPQLEVQLRHPSCVVLTEHPETPLWYPIPGMYGGFNIQLMCNYLYVESWCRVAGGSGQAHVVTTEGFTLVDEGFV